jgi:hypothetical protein
VSGYDVADRWTAMAKTAAMTPSEYLKSLPADRRKAITEVRKVILEHLPAGYEEQISAGMLAYVVPFSRLADTYNGHPLWYVALASQKNYMALHLMSLYGDASTEQWFRAQFKARGKKLEMGKACVRFTSLDDLPLDVIGETIAKVPIDTWIKVYQQSRAKPRASRPARAARGTRAGAAKAR